MKRNLLAVIAVITAFTFSSYTIKFNIVFYLVYNTGSQTSMGNFIITTNTQESILGNDIAAWVSIESVDAQLENGEFMAAFSALDEDGDNSLNDEDEKDRTFFYNGQSGLHAVLEKKAAELYRKTAN